MKSTSFKNILVFDTIWGRLSPRLSNFYWFFIHLGHIIHTPLLKLVCEGAKETKAEREARPRRPGIGKTALGAGPPWPV